jgi:integral membrane protein
MGDPGVWLRRVTMVEAVSYLLLLVATALKYGWSSPVGAQLVRVLGMAHGLLFLWMGLLLMRVLAERQWPVGRVALIFVASLVPFAPFLLDRRFPAWIAAGRRG